MYMYTDVMTRYSLYMIAMALYGIGMYHRIIPISWR